MTTITAIKSPKTRKPLTLEEECPICKAAGYRLRPEVEEAIERSHREGLVSFNSIEEFFADLDACAC